MMYLFYLDESGEREYESNSQYFVLCALGVPVPQWQSLNTQVNNLKIAYFGTSEVEIKSSWLRRNRERQKRYLQTYSISEESLQRFTHQVYQIILQPSIVLFACVIDKHAWRAMSSTPGSPVVCAYQTLLSQLEFFLHTRQTYGMVVFDKINDTWFKSRGYEKELAELHNREHAESSRTGSAVRIVEGLLFLPSHERNFIQLADLCAYNIYRQLVDYGDEWETGFISKYEYFARIEGKLIHEDSGNYKGFGLVRYP